MNQAIDDEADARAAADADLVTYTRKFIGSLQTTAEARFNAARRLEGRSRLINLMLALLSSSVIVTSVLPIAHKFSEPIALMIFFVGLGAAIFVVVLSLYQWSSRDDVNAEKLHQAGLKISELRRRVNLEYLSTNDPSAIGSPEDWLNEAVEDYNDILRECGINHSESDYLSVKMSHLKKSEYGFVARLSFRCAQATQQFSALFIFSFMMFAAVLVVCFVAFNSIVN